MERIIVTGSSGFIGLHLCERLRLDNLVFALCNGFLDSKKFENILKITCDINDYQAVDDFVDRNRPDVVIHCAGIAHQKIGRKSRSDYFQVNSMATEHLAKAAVSANPDVYFIFLSSVCVYGEYYHSEFIAENSVCNPSSDYAESKRDAELRLQALFEEGKIKRLDILRLSPVYDSSWSLNLDRRVFWPGKRAYLRFGNGDQKISAVSRQNLIDFMEYLILNREKFGEKYCNTYNVCDERAYTFNQIIETFKRSGNHPDGHVFNVPLLLVWGLTRIAGLVFKTKKKWLHSCYDKLARDLIFDNKRMLSTGFSPSHTLESVFCKPQITKSPEEQ